MDNNAVQNNDGGKKGKGKEGAADGVAKYVGKE